jgi:rubrerythrin
MTVEEAIVTALQHENRVRDHYAWAAEQAGDPKGKKFFEVLAREEQGHVDYLESRLTQWRAEGQLAAEPLKTVIPSPDFLAEGMKMLQTAKETKDHSDDYKRLFTALQLEEEVSVFYKGLVENLENPEAKAMFQRFLEIEDGHTSIVQAEVDVLTRTGYFYDFQEFNLED